jgi:DNA-directed RNA polymerase subunit D
MPKISFVEEYPKTQKFLVENTEPVLLNTFRRIVGYNIFIYAIDEIDFIENDSIIYDEFLANRVGLVPIITPKENTGKKVTFSLEKEGPCTVYSKDLISNDKDIKVAYDTIPLTKLEENQNLRFEAFAILGQGSIHTKFTPVIVGYQQISNLKVLRGCDGCEACLNACPNNNIKMVSKKPVMIDINKCVSCRACVDACPKDCLNLEDTKDYFLTIETIGQCSIEDLIAITQRYIKEYFSLLKKKIK